MSKETLIELEAPSGSGYRRSTFKADHAANLLRMSKLRGWGWRITKGSEWAFDESNGTFYRVEPKPRKKKD
jgi:hypothetical protein